jgi:hypothetical protein
MLGLAIAHLPASTECGAIADRVFRPRLCSPKEAIMGSILTLPSRSARAEPRVLPYGAWLTDARLSSLGFSPRDVRSIHRGEPIGRVLPLRGRSSARLILALAIMGVGLLSLTVASPVGRATAATEHARTASIIKVIVPPSAESSHAAAAPSGALPSSAAISKALFQLGFLEFEDDADAPSR